MELCLCFGCPHPDLLARSLTGREIRQWQAFAEVRGLPTRTGLQVAQLEWLTRVINSSKDDRKHIPSPGELVVGVAPKPKQEKPGLNKSLSTMLHVLRKRLLAKDGKDTRHNHD